MAASIVRIYRGNSLTEVEIGEKQSIVVGNDNSCDVRLNSRITVSLSKQVVGWVFSADESVVVKGNRQSDGVVNLGEMLVIDSKDKLAIAILPAKPNFEKMIEFADLKALTVGRSPDNTISIASKQASGKHALFLKKGNAWYISDAGSSNGTYINGKTAKDSVLKAGDVIDISMCRISYTDTGLLIRSFDSVVLNLPFSSGKRAVKDGGDEYPYQFKRSPRLKSELPSGEIEIQPPPAIGAAPSINWLTVLLPPLAMIVVMGGMVMVTGGSTTSLFFTLPMTFISMVVSIANYRSQKNKHSKSEVLREEKYNEYLKRIIAELDAKADEQRKKLTSINPPVDECVGMVKDISRELWDRKPGDADFMSLRVGGGDVPFGVDIKAPKQAFAMETDPLLDKAASIADKYKTVLDCPVVFDLLRHPTGGITGDRRSAVTLARSMAVHAATHHCYDELKIIIICPKNELREWEGIRWLPHVFDNDRRERYIAADPASAATLLNTFEDVLAQRTRESNHADGGYIRMQLPYLLFIFADADMVERHGVMRYLARNDPDMGTGAVFLFDGISRLPKECSLIIEVAGSKGTLYSKDDSDVKMRFQLERTGRDTLDGFARAMAPIRVESILEEGQLPSSISFLQGYCVKKPQELPIEANWHNASPSRTMSVPIGVKANGERFVFDIHEKAYGPHGLVAGMTGSGKSEMIQSWILSMAIKYLPQAVSFVLIDFKGTGLILPFRNLPHLAGTISDLDTSIGRNLIALENELSRRKALLDQHGVSNISGYLKLYGEGKATEALSYLFVVIDEFAEFRVRFPDFMQVIDRVFAIGRTLGVHIILLTQKPANIVNEKMQANTRFRWCLKVASSSDSKDMLRHPDAAKITVPGRAYVQVGEDEVYEQIQSYWSGAPYDPGRDPSARRKERVSVVNLSGARTNYETEKTTGYRAEKNEVDAVVDYLDDYVRKNGIERARSIWTNKLPEHISLDSILSIAFDGEEWNKSNLGLYIPVGMIDDPRSQSQYPLRLAPHEDGHFVVYGAPGTGKTTFLQTVVMSMALSFPPDQINIYIMDFGGGSMNIFRELPHLGGVAVSGEDEKIDKLARLLGAELEERRKRFSAFGLVGIDAYRDASGEKLPYIALVLDNFAPALSMYPDLENFFVSLTRDGGGYGIYMFVSTGNTMSLSYRITQNIKSAAALNMTDKSEYASVVGRTNGFEPENFPGRGLVKGSPPLEFQTALPASGKNENERISSIRRLSALMGDKWDGRRPGAIPVMPDRVTLDMFGSEGICVGLGTDDMRPVPLPFNAEPFTIISAKNGSGRAELLQALVRQFYERAPGISIALFDSPSGNLAPVKPMSDNYCNGGEKIDEYIHSLIPELNERKNIVAGDGAEFGPLLIVASDIGSLFESVSNETMNRLAAIVTLGRGLEVYLVAAGDTDDIAKLYHGDKFTMSMVDKSTAILLGGSFKSHVVFKADISYTESECQLGEHEGYLLANGKLKKFKAVGQ